MTAAAAGPRRLPKAERRRQLLETAMRIVRDEGADRLTLGLLAIGAGVSKPVVYDHFATRSALLIELYRWIDMERVDAFQASLTAGRHGRAQTVRLLAAAYIRCAADTGGEFHAVGAALAGSAEKAAVFQELLAHAVQMFIEVLAPHSSAPPADLRRRCVGLIGAGEALSAALIRGEGTEAGAIDAFASLIGGALRSPGA